MPDEPPSGVASSSRAASVPAPTMQAIFENLQRLLNRVERIEAAAERELGLIESALIPVTRRKDASSAAKAAEMAREIAGHLEVVRSSLIRSALTRL